MNPRGIRPGDCGLDYQRVGVERLESPTTLSDTPVGQDKILHLASWPTAATHLRIGLG